MGLTEKYWDRGDRLDKPQISVIVPVKNGAATIEKCLESIFSQSLPPAEVIVVDNGSQDETIRKAGLFPVKILIQNFGRIGAARQMGLENSSGEYVAFTDSDCIPCKDWLRELFHAFDQGVAGVGGAIKNIGDGLWINSINLTQDTFIGGGRSIQARLYKNKTYVKSISGCNAMYRRKDLIDIGGFNIYLTGADETELNHRLVKLKKGKLLYIPEALILHDHRRNLGRFAVNMYRYGGWRKECGVWDLPAIPAMASPFVFLILIFSPWAAVSLLLLYFMTIFAMGGKFSIRERNIKYLFSIPLVYLVQHTCYTIGFWKEMIIPKKNHIRMKNSLVPKREIKSC
jgi:glycosyltransferase involved in cell wall biosynthesis